MPKEERAPYEDMARNDKERFEEESRIRDQEMLRQQEERRAKNALTETSTRMRESTVRKKMKIDVLFSLLSSLFSLLSSLFSLLALLLFLVHSLRTVKLQPFG
jgi:hypothetical protein